MYETKIRIFETEFNGEGARYWGEITNYTLTLQSVLKGILIIEPENCYYKPLCGQKMDKETYRDIENHRLASLAAYYRRVNAKQSTDFIGRAENVDESTYLKQNNLAIDSYTQTEKVKTRETHTQTGTHLDIEENCQNIHSTKYYGEPVFMDPLPNSDRTKPDKIVSLEHAHVIENLARGTCLIGENSVGYKQELTVTHTENENASNFFDDDNDHKDKGVDTSLMLDESQQHQNPFAGNIKAKSLTLVSSRSMEDFHVDDISLHEIEEQVRKAHMRLVKRGIMPDFQIEE